MAHLADRTIAHYQAIVTGASVTFVPEVTQVIGALVEVRPTFWGAVPRVWEKLKAALEAGFAAETDPELRDGSRGALAEAIEIVRAEQAGESVPPERLRRREAADAEFFAPLRSMLGLDEADYLISGAAPIARGGARVLLRAGPADLRDLGHDGDVADRHQQPAATGSGSAPSARRCPEVEVALAQDGELLVSGPIVMRGYRGEQELTAQTIDPDGWLHTGDIAEIDPDGYVRIVDRKKELIINAAGKNMSPANIENRIKAACPLVGSVVAIGDRRPFNTALVVLDPVAVAAFAAAHGLDRGTPAELSRDPPVQAEVARGHRARQRGAQPGGADQAPHDPARGVAARRR